MSRIFINSKGKTFYEASEGHIASCWLDGNQYWPYYQGQPDYETDTITKIGKVHYNKGKNYIIVDFTDGLHIVAVGDEFEVGIAMDDRFGLTMLFGVGATEADPHRQRVRDGVDGRVEALIGPLRIVVVA